ncbi:MAG: hypothetical protein AAB426_03710 [Myxococcota bacterium]
MSRRRHSGWAVLASLALGTLADCLVERVDLTGDVTHTDPSECAPGTRLSPATGRCRTCITRTPAPEDTCLCAWEYHASPYPYCNGAEDDYDCLPCAGDITSCNAYDATTHVVSSCDRLKACCDELAAVGSRCCAAGTDLYCPLDAWTSTLSYACCACVGAVCDNDLDCDLGQSCDTNQVPGRCTPPCKPTEPNAEICCVDCGCQCVPRAQ